MGDKIYKVNIKEYFSITDDIFIKAKSEQEVEDICQDLKLVNLETLGLNDFSYVKPEDIPDYDSKSFKNKGEATEEDLNLFHKKVLTAQDVQELM